MAAFPVVLGWHASNSYWCRDPDPCSSVPLSSWIYVGLLWSAGWCCILHDLEPLPPPTGAGAWWIWQNVSLIHCDLVINCLNHPTSRPVCIFSINKEVQQHSLSILLASRLDVDVHGLRPTLLVFCGCTSLSTEYILATVILGLTLWMPASGC